MKSFFSFLSIAVLGLPMAAQAATIVNVSATSSHGATVTLGAGTYEVSVIGTKQGGQFNGWDLTDGSCQKSSNKWSEEFDLTVGKNANSYELSGDPTFNSASNALAAYQNGILYKNGAQPADAKDDIAIFSIAKGQSVDFYIPDAGKCNVSGGVSLQIDPVASASATPEPSTFGLMGLVTAGGVILAFRRRKLERQS